MKEKAIHFYGENNEILCNKNLSSVALETTTDVNEVTCKNCKYILSRQRNLYKIYYRKCAKCKKRKQTFEFDERCRICISCMKKEERRVYELNKKLHPDKHIMGKQIIF